MRHHAGLTRPSGAHPTRLDWVLLAALVLAFAAMIAVGAIARA